ncbi:SpoIIE family protein phosphatase [Fimbriiglobus ruber]|uniref:Serine phosphatase RsbU, regulator of sigma subunit n=1 Tax=Fimbriiglobus ruber TaxID=1908690 RepID=A0A225CZD9_9BACT|nr:SpoIIE family protein phosphatase [Fimbriiglobus ruber]OWK34730.1 Serine phosphatase RsbU, regulator of sigma subunit [Fimbriiglobus ruber]
MNRPPIHTNGTPTTGTTRVLLIDDQPMIGEAVRRMLAPEAGIEFHFCPDPKAAIPTANRVRPTVILQDLVMPDIDGLMLVRYFRANPTTADTPMIVLSSQEEAVTKADAFAAGANDYLVKLPDRIELLARIRYHSQGYVNLLQRNAAYQEIAAGRKRLADEVAAGVRYVRSLLPNPWRSGRDKAVSGIDWRYVPCTEMGGDALGYHRIDADHLALYLLDVTGHGLASALLGVTVLNVLRTGTLPNTDFRDPGQVLFGLNEAFPCEKHGEKFFTIWYGVYHGPSRVLTWSGGGHPPALLYTGGAGRREEPTQLDSQGPMIGMMPWPAFETGRREIPSAARLYVYSDGAQEIHKTDGSDWTMPEFVEALTSFVASEPTTVMDALHQHIRELNGSDVLDDDFSMLEVDFE